MNNTIIFELVKVNENEERVIKFYENNYFQIRTETRNNWTTYQATKKYNWGTHIHFKTIVNEDYDIIGYRPTLGANPFPQNTEQAREYAYDMLICCDCVEEIQKMIENGEM